MESFCFHGDQVGKCIHVLNITQDIIKHNMNTNYTIFKSKSFDREGLLDATEGVDKSQNLMNIDDFTFSLPTPNHKK